MSTLLGSVLRIDADVGDPYSVPADNPFTRVDGAAEEIWAYGFRNPYGLSLHLETGDLFVADAGQALFEEINRIDAPGLNFGWNIREGVECFNPDDFLEPPDDCRSTGYRGEPRALSALISACSVVGGVIVSPSLWSRAAEGP